MSILSIIITNVETCMFTLDERVVLYEIIDKVLTIEEANLRNLNTVKFNSGRRIKETIKKVRNLRSVKLKLEGLR